MNRPILLGLLAVFLVGSCTRATRGVFGPICPADDWAEKMAGDNYVNCGGNHYDASDRQLRALDKCIARGLASKHTVAFGYMAATPDSGICGFAILSGESLPIIASYSYDYSFPNGDERRGPHAFLGECQRVVVKKKHNDPSLPFEAEGCHFDREAYDRVTGN